MAQYHVELPDGTAYNVEAPDNLSDTQIQKMVTDDLAGRRPGQSFGTPQVDRSRLGLGPTPEAGFQDSLINSAIPFADELAGVAAVGVNAIKAPFSDQVDFNPLAAYRAGSGGDRQAITEYRHENPVSAFTGDILGGLSAVPSAAVAAIPQAASTIGRIAQGAKIGAGLGAYQGVGNGEGLGRIGSGIAGAIGGGLIGGALPAIGSIVSPIASGVRRLVTGGEGLAAQRVAEAMQADNLTPRVAGSMMDNARANGVPSMLADQGENLQRLAGAVYRKPGDSRSLVADALRNRQMGQYDRVSGAISRDLGPIDNVNQRSDELIQQARTAAAPLYEQAYQAPAIGSPNIDAILSTPSGRSAVARANKIAADEMRNPRSLGFAVDENGDVILNPVNTDAITNHSSARAAVDAAQDAYRFALRTPGQNVTAARARLVEAREAFRSAEAALKDMPTPGVAATTPQYSPQTLDYVKRGLDDMVESHRDPVTRRLNLDEAGRAIDGLRRNLRNEVDTLNPTYGQARRAYEGPVREKDALYQGSQALNRSAGDLDRQLANMSESERQQFALGMRSALDDNLSRRVDGGDKVGALLGTPQRREVLRRAAGPDANFDRFASTMDAERRAGDTYRIAMTGSPTAINVNDDALVGDAGIAADAVNRFIRGNGGIVGRLANVAAPLLDANRFGAGRAGDRVRQGIASLLTETDPNAFAVALRNLETTQAAREIRASKRRMFGRGLGQLSSSAAGSLLSRSVAQ